MSTDGKDKGWVKKGGIKSLQMFAADVAGNAADLVFLKYQNNIDKAFPVLKSSFKQVMYYPLKALQKPIEAMLGHLGSIEGAEAKEERLQQAPEKRLDGLIDASYHYLSAGAVGFATLAGTEKLLSNVMHTGHVPNKMWWRLDAPVHLVTALFMGSRTMQPATSALKGTLKKVMVASGWSEEKAEQDARFTIAYILPNYLTLIPTTGMMAHLYHAESQGIVKQVESKGWFGGVRHGFESTNKTPAPGELGIVTESVLKVARLLGIVGGPSAAKSAAH